MIWSDVSTKCPLFSFDFIFTLRFKWLKYPSIFNRSRERREENDIRIRFCKQIGIESSQTSVASCISLDASRCQTTSSKNEMFTDHGSFDYRVYAHGRERERNRCISLNNDDCRPSTNSPSPVQFYP